MPKHIPDDDYTEDQFFSPEAVVAKPTRTRTATPQSGNPLSAYFRMPGLHVSLPTNGEFFPEGTFEPSINGEVPIFPMRAQDELLLRNPDALMSGYALEKLIESCVPSIKAPRLVSTPDLDVLLLAIRAATYGESMEVDVKCPSCGTDNVFDCHLPSIVSKMTYIDPINDVRISDELVIRVRPYNMGSATKMAITSFNEARKLQSIDAETDERRLAQNESYQKLNVLNLEGIADCIIHITIPTGVVTDRNFIFEFINNTGQSTVKKVEAKILEMNEKGIDKHVDVVCAKCSHAWSPEVEFDPTSFFDLSS
jgi:hypothetical protein